MDANLEAAVPSEDLQAALPEEPAYTPLKGEGEVQYVKRTRCRQECAECGEPAHFRHTYLLGNARRNPASSAYGRDDCSWCSDAESFVCAEHERKRQAPDGHDWCATFPLATFPHLGLYWSEEKIVPMVAA